MEADELAKNWRDQHVANVLAVLEDVPPYDESMTALVNEVTNLAALTMDAGPGFRYQNYYHLTAAYGTPRSAPLELPSWVKPAELGQCFRNCWHLALDNPDDLTYVEGYAQTTFFPTGHAWLETPDGTIIDPTWSNPEVTRRQSEAHYYGIRFSPDFVFRYTQRSGWASIFGGDDAHMNHTLLRHGLVVDDEGTAIDFEENK